MALRAKDAHPDSLTTIINDVVEERALKAGDIRKLKRGEEIEVILFDRNIGDYYSDKKPGKYSTKKYIDSYHKAIYTHDHGLTGKMFLIPVNEYIESNVSEWWTWEVNARPWTKKLYWSPLESLTEKDIPDDVKVGWRGPSILYEDLSYMPKSFRIYDTAVDDYFVIRNFDLTPFNTTNRLTER